MACDWSSSDGLGGIGPQVRTWRPVSAVLLEGVGEGDLADQHVGGADGTVEPEALGDQGAAQVGLDEHDALAGHARW